jgi:hypothetical protein
MPSFCRVITKLKGFKDYIHIYQVKENLKPSTEYKNTTILSDIKTHLFNISYYAPNDEQCELIEPAEEEKNKKEMEKINSEILSLKTPNTKTMIDDSVTIFGREKQLIDCLKKIEHAIKNKLTTYILITGEYGTGKSLFIRCLMKKYLDEIYSNNSINKNKYKNIFNTTQLPNTYFDPLNGFKTIIKEIYKIVCENYPCNIISLYY